MRRHLYFSLLVTLFVSSGAFGAAPLLSFDQTSAIVTVTPGHRVAWITTWHSTSAYETGISAPAGADGVVRITPGVGLTGTWIVADAETGEWLTRASVQAPGKFSNVSTNQYSRIVVPGPTGAYSLLEVGDDRFGGGLWIRPGVGVWASPSAGWEGPFVVTTGSVRQVDVSGLSAVGSSPAAPAGFERGDVLLMLTPERALTGLLDPIFDRAAFPGYLEFRDNSPARELRITEGRTVTVDVVRTGGTAGTVTTTCTAATNYGGSFVRAPKAVPGVDYVEPAPQLLTFGPGETVKQCTVTLLDDAFYTDLPRDLSIVLSPPTGGALILYRRELQTILIEDDDPVPVLTFDALPASVMEGDTTWTLNAAWSLVGTFRGAVTVRTWHTLQEVTPETAAGRPWPVEIPADDIPTGYGNSRSFDLYMYPSDDRESRIARVTRTLTVVEDDMAPAAISMSAAPTLEGDSTNINATVNVRLASALPSPLTVRVDTVTGGTAEAFYDYSPVTEMVTFQAGETQKTVRILVIGDRLDEGDETIAVAVRYETVTVATAMVTIIDNDRTTPSVSLTAAPVTEGNSGNRSSTVIVQLATALSAPVTLTVATLSTGTAEANADYVPFSQSLTFLAGETQKTVTLVVKADTLDESDETIDLAVTSEGMTLATLSVTIQDDDDPPGASMASISDTAVMENTGPSAFARFSIQLVPAPALAGSVQYATVEGSATAGEDYAAASGTLQFSAGQTLIELAVEIFGDARTENDERFSVRLSNASGISLRDDHAIATIHDDDVAVPATPVLSIDDPEVRETNGWSEATFTLRLSHASSATTRVSFDTTAATATAPSDYEGRSGVVTFAPGQTSQSVVVRIAGDTVHEQAETFALALFNADGLLAPDTSGVCTIRDDDEPRKRRAARH